MSTPIEFSSRIALQSGPQFICQHEADEHAAAGSSCRQLTAVRLSDEICPVESANIRVDLSGRTERGAFVLFTSLFVLNSQTQTTIGHKFAGLLGENEIQVVGQKLEEELELELGSYVGAVGTRVSFTVS